jgi:hypothetical protein
MVSRAGGWVGGGGSGSRRARWMEVAAGGPSGRVGDSMLSVRWN